MRKDERQAKQYSRAGHVVVRCVDPAPEHVWKAVQQAFKILESFPSCILIMYRTSIQITFPEDEPCHSRKLESLAHIVPLGPDFFPQWHPNNRIVCLLGPLQPYTEFRLLDSVLQTPETSVPTIT